jgi:uncharacterized membrane protein
MAGRERTELLKLSGMLALAATGCLLLFGLRVAISGKTFYSFLVWNLCLAASPYAIAGGGTRLIARSADRAARSRGLVTALVAVLWLAFYPNAPYIFTDFIHVVNRTYIRQAPAEWLGRNALLWYDLLMTAAFAFIGHFIGLVSMWLVHSSLARAWGKGAARAVVGVAILLAGLGIYLGRFSRLNTWDIVLGPRKVLAEMAEATAEPGAMLFSLAFSLFVFLTYAALLVFKRIAPEGSIDQRKED